MLTNAAPDLEKRSEVGCYIFFVNRCRQIVATCLRDRLHLVLASLPRGLPLCTLRSLGTAETAREQAETSMHRPGAVRFCVSELERNLIGRVVKMSCFSDKDTEMQRK